MCALEVRQTRARPAPGRTRSRGRDGLYCVIGNKAREGTFIVKLTLIIAILTLHLFRSRFEPLKVNSIKYNSGNLHAFSFSLSFAFTACSSSAEAE